MGCVPSSTSKSNKENRPMLVYTNAFMPSGSFASIPINTPSSSFIDKQSRH
jgi:hypothetical protein